MNKCCNALLFFSKRIKKFGFFLFEKYSISNKLFTVLYFTQLIGLPAG